MNKELEEAIRILEIMLSCSDDIMSDLRKDEVQAIKTAIDYINNSTPNNTLYDLAREMRKDGSMYYASRIEEIIKTEHL